MAMQEHTSSIQWQVQVLDLSEAAKDLAKVVHGHIPGQFLDHNLLIELVSEA